MSISILIGPHVMRTREVTFVGPPRSLVRYVFCERPQRAFPRAFSLGLETAIALYQRTFINNVLHNSRSSAISQHIQILDSVNENMQI
jgi:hypothetical protein